MGPIELADLVGLDICRAVGEELAKPGTPKPKALLARLAAKQLGRKTGLGFYTWVGDKPRRPAAPKGADLATIADRLIVPALNEAVVCLRENIVADADLCDAGIIFGTGFAPHRGGPIATIRARGKDAWLEVMATLRARHGERFAPDSGWESL
jgi:3-hydroxyacyl-CoA dehydrogenase/enoyl-CoA hydratase/3-hydroxybutyryl-CoA epimerase